MRRPLKYRVAHDLRLKTLRGIRVLRTTILVIDHRIHQVGLRCPDEINMYPRNFPAVQGRSDRRSSRTARFRFTCRFISTTPEMCDKRRVQIARRATTVVNFFFREPLNRH
jgi:hypothetical protein